MPRITFALVAATFALAVVSRAQVVPPPDDQGPIIGLYTAIDVTGDAETHARLIAYPAELEVHAVLSHPGVAALGALEMRVEFAPALAEAVTGLFLWNGSPVWDWWLSWPDVAIFWPTPEPVVDGHAWVMSMRLEVSAPLADGGIRLVPMRQPSVPGAMAFVGADDPGTILTMRPNSQGLSHDNPVFVVNPGATAVASRSFSAVKSLFAGASPTLP